MVKMKNKFLITSAILLSMFGVTSCGNRPLMSMIGGLPVESLTLESVPVAQSSIYQANLISRHSVTLQPQVAGQVFGIYVKAGQHVKAGQILMTIDSRKQQATLDSNRATAEAAKSDIAQARDQLANYQVQRDALVSSLNLNKQLYNRYKTLYGKHTVSQQDLEKYTDSYNKAKADLDANTAQLQAQKSAIITAQSNYKKALFSTREQAAELQYYKIVAPYAGVVGDIPVKVGNYVTNNTQLLSVTQNNQLEINVGLPVEKVFDIHPGLPVEVLDNKNNVVGKSKVSFISPMVNTNTQTILVKAILNNDKGVLKADQSVKVRVVFNQNKGVKVPTSAVSHLGGQDFVFLVQPKGGKMFVKQIPIKLGDLQGNDYVVLNGLHSGQQIVSQGIQKLMDGAPVTILTGRK